jgi:hypothetical protein
MYSVVWTLQALAPEFDDLFMVGARLESQSLFRRLSISINEETRLMQVPVSDLNPFID